MTSARVTHTIDDLAADMLHIATEAPKDMAESVKKNANAGLRYARSIAKQSAGRHGVHYPKSITAERVSALVWVYGPDSALPQGGMSFEGGSVNQKPHRDLAKSADIIGPRFAHDVSNLPDRWFW